MTEPLCIVVKGFPRVSETFITRELEALQDAGVKFLLASLRRPGPDASKVSHMIRTAPTFLPEYLHEEPARSFHGFCAARRMPGYAVAWRAFQADLSRDWTRNRVRRFGQACVLAMELPQGVRHLHAHFIHTPTSVARYAAIMRGLTFSVSAHAKDIWTSPEWDVRQKIADSQFVHVCNQTGADRLRSIDGSDKVRFRPHLVAEFVGAMTRIAAGGEPIRLLTVARAVGKKGLKTLLAALQLLPSKPSWTWTHIGGGPLLPELKLAARSHPYADRLSLLGVQPHAAVLEALGQHHIFVLAAEETDDGDRDGRPNALIEAMSAGLACIASRAGGIPELLGEGAGVLSDAEPTAFSNAIIEVMTSPESLSKLSAAAVQRAASLRQDGLASIGGLVKDLRKASGQ